MATALTVIQNAAAEIGVPVGATISSTDLTMQRMLALLNRTGKNLRRAAAWPECLKRYTFDLVEDQTRYTLPVDWDAWANETAWNEDTNRWLIGPLTPNQYEYIANGISVSVVNQKYRVRGIVRYIDIIPEPTSTDAGNTVVYEYFSKNWLRPANEWVTSTSYSTGDYVYYVDNIYKATTTGTSGATAPTHMGGAVSDGGVTWQYVEYEEILSDTDVVVLDEEVLTLGLIYRFLDGKGVMAQKYELEYNKVLKERIGQTLGGRVLDMVGHRYRQFATREYNMPDIVVP